MLRCEPLNAGANLLVEAKMNGEGGKAYEGTKRQSAWPVSVEAIGLAKVRIPRRPQRDDQQQCQRPQWGKSRCSCCFQISGPKSFVELVALQSALQTGQHSLVPAVA